MLNNEIMQVISVIIWIEYFVHFLVDVFGAYVIKHAYIVKDVHHIFVF